jgi:hypothetical protein
MNWNFIGEVFTTSVLTSALLGLLVQYLMGKLKHDLNVNLENIKHELNVELEKVKPFTAEETLKKQNYINSKRETFFEALELLNKFHESTPWSGPDIPKDRPISNTRPSESEVNTVVAKMALYSDSAVIVMKYLDCFNNASPVLIGHLMNLMRIDLGYGELPFNPDEYLRFFKREPEKT